MRIAILTLFVSLSTGCIVHTHRGPNEPRSQHHGKHRSRGQGSDSCGPAHHMEGGRCVHNGNGRHRGHD